jgi:predicted nucleic acid-binding protein
MVLSLWHLELANTLVVGERRGRCTQAEATAFLARLAGLPIGVDPHTMAHAWADTIRLARTHTLSAYDAAYLELAIRQGLPLATLDARLATAAAAAGVATYTPPPPPTP